MMRKLIVFLALGAPLAEEPTLVKVIGLGRHGNREANAEVDTLCPRAARYVPFVGDANKYEAALTGTGELQCMMAGQFLRNRYVAGGGGLGAREGFLPGHPPDDRTTFFYADASDRNVACLDIAKRTMFKGVRAGDRGFRGTANRSHVLPILTTRLGHDTVMRLPHHHQCQGRAHRDAVQYGAVHEPQYREAHRALLAKLGEVCGFDFGTLVCGDRERGAYGGKCLSWGIKSVTDAIEFARYEGFDWTLGGKLTESDRVELVALSRDLINTQDLRLDAQVTYTVGDFPSKALLENIRRPGPEQATLTAELQGVTIDRAAHPWQPTPLEFYYHNKFLLFWNHRELITGLLLMFNGTDAAGAPVSPFPSTGAVVLWEVWEDSAGLFVRYFTWQLPGDPKRFVDRSLIWPELRHGALRRVDRLGALTEIFPAFCRTPGRCTVPEFEAAYVSWIQRTGTWQEICGGAEACQPDELARVRGELEAVRQELAALRQQGPRAELLAGQAPPRGARCLLLASFAVAGLAVLVAWGARRRRRLHAHSSYIAIYG